VSNALAQLLNDKAGVYLIGPDTHTDDHFNSFRHIRE
jgi:hypothetical protein